MIYLNNNFISGLILLTYLVTNISYSSLFKKVPYLEILFVSSGFVFRVIIGTHEAQLDFSFWLISLIALGSVLLVIGKRKAEIQLKLHDDLKRNVLKFYNEKFLSFLITLICILICLGYIGFLISSDLLINNIFFSTSSFLLIFTGISRYLYLILVKKIDLDPNEILTKDFLIFVVVIMYFFIFLSFYYL
jgi:decaprenyl-phosphate phosphoribosyltransferase